MHCITISVFRSYTTSHISNKSQRMRAWIFLPDQITIISLKLEKTKYVPNRDIYTKRERGIW
jgi:hypothetical protein